jgi:hypothetical protein
MNKTSDYDADKVEEGDYLLLRYGNGTQLVYVDGLVSSSRNGVTKKLHVMRLYYRNTTFAGIWKCSAPIKIDDPRILGFAKPWPDTPPIN